MEPSTVVVFRLGDVCLKIMQTAPLQYLTTIEKLLSPELKKENPGLAHVFTPTDLSALRKLIREAEDALFNFQSIVLEVPSPSKEADPKTTEQEKD